MSLAKPIASRDFWSGQSGSETESAEIGEQRYDDGGRAALLLSSGNAHLVTDRERPP